MNINVLRNLSYGVYAVTTLDGERPTGCIANSAMQITSTPATIAVSINHDNFTNECIEKSGRLAVSILSEKTDPSIIGTFGYHSGKDIDKFEKMDYEMIDGLPIIKDSCGYIVCKVVDKFETATHTIFLGEIVDGDVLQDENPMTYAYYHKVIKGSSPKNAPTYIPEEQEVVAEETVPEEKASIKQYVCTVCGYIYDGDEVPEDYKCPICGVGKDKFKEVTE